MSSDSRNEGGVGSTDTVPASYPVGNNQDAESASNWLLSGPVLQASSSGSSHGTSSTTSVNGPMPSVSPPGLVVNTSQTRSGAKTVAWGDLPRKDQLTVITLARLSEPLVQTSLQSYMFYQLKWFDPSLPDSVISSQAGILQFVLVSASFTAAQFVTSMMWGRVADSRRFGRKTVLLIGLFGTMLSCLGFGFSTTFWQALFFRSLGGITNGNVGVLRTIETVQEKKYQSRAFLLLPMTFNIGTIIGPILGGVLSDPAGSYPSLFGDIWFFRKFPYAAPNILSATFLFCAILLTLDLCAGQRDRGLEIGHSVKLWVSQKRSKGGYSRLPAEDPIAVDIETHPLTLGPDSQHSSISDAAPFKPKYARRRYTQRLPFRRIFTQNVVSTFMASCLLSLHVGTFNSLWFVFLSTPVYDPSKGPESPDAFRRHLPFVFTGGLGLHPREVGMAMAILGVLGIALQLGIYPWLSARLGTVRSWRMFLLFFPFTYFIAPYLSLVPSASPPPAPKDGFVVWLAIAGVLCFHVIGRTFALPAQTILVNNCTPHPSVLGTVHGIGQSVSSLSRTVGPFLGGFLYGQGLARGIVGAVFWCLSAIAIGGIVASLFVHEGDGHEIWLEGDEDDDA
ncbi:major facilitator superfamily domain-containing protein [Cercophora samala]|uniref:Major facilitator superfamily domain-containing protein n=1 Tax=Cercophora samala TaxID=330535 RepID=A0AA39YXI8_9PEZI|nr:major facilitator superfamily domain-containing protein [Cercophora samala]